MGEKLFELLVITIAGGVVADIIGSSINDGAMPKRRLIGLFISTLIIVIGVCVYFQIPVLSSIVVSIVDFKITLPSTTMGLTADMPWWVIADVLLFFIVTIYPSVRERSVRPFLAGLEMVLLIGGMFALIMAAFSLLLVVISAFTEIPLQVGILQALLEGALMGLELGLLVGPVCLLVCDIFD